MNICSVWLSARNRTQRTTSPKERGCLGWRSQRTGTIRSVEMLKLLWTTPRTVEDISAKIKSATTNTEYEYSQDVPEAQNPLACLSLRNRSLTKGIKPYTPNVMGNRETFL